jgi:hypothetical protein
MHSSPKIQQANNEIYIHVNNCIFHVNNTPRINPNFFRSKQFIFVQVTNNEGRTSSLYGDIPGQDSQFEIGEMPMYLGGLPGNITEETDGLYVNGLKGCVLQLRAAKVVRQLEEIRLQDHAINGTRVTSCVIT